MNHALIYTHRVQGENVWRINNNLYPQRQFFRINTDRLCSFDGHKAVIPLLPTDIAKGSVVCDVLGNVGDLMDSVVVLEDLQKGII